MNITRYMPFRDLEDLMGNWHLPWDERELQFLGGKKWMPAVDIEELDKEFLLKIEVPEVEKKDLHIEIANGMLTVKGERREEKVDKKLHRKERFFGRFERSFALPENVREDNVSAEQKNGMLYIHLGKTEIGQAPRKLDIKVN